MSENRFIVTTKLEGYVNALKPAGKFNNCCFSFTLSKQDMAKFDEAYEQAMVWGENKMAGKRFTKELPKWDESGLIKYSYGGDSSSPMFPWVDTDGVPLDLDTQIWKGTVVKLIIDLKPYVYSTKVGCSLKVKGAQVIKLVSSGGSDSGGLDTEDVAALFGTTDGFKLGSPSYEPNPQEDSDEDEDDMPF
jgi:hypothetical protein